MANSMREATLPLILKNTLGERGRGGVYLPFLLSISLSRWSTWSLWLSCASRARLHVHYACRNTSVDLKNILTYIYYIYIYIYIYIHSHASLLHKHTYMYTPPRPQEWTKACWDSR